MKIILFSLLLFILISCSPNPPEVTNGVTVVGAMRNVMMKGQLYGTIDLDSLSDRPHLYGLGPVENLAGELLIIDGKSYKSTVSADSSMKVEETYAVKAPFFGYSLIPSWTNHDVPTEIHTIQELEDYLLEHFPQGPYIFRMSGAIEKAVIHVVNLPAGSTVSSPQEAHVGQVNYDLSTEEVDIIGFFSTEHKAIFTHHDTNLHMHLITKDRSKMGHLDAVELKKIKLYLPK